MEKKRPLMEGSRVIQGKFAGYCGRTAAPIPHRLHTVHRILTGLCTGFVDNSTPQNTSNSTLLG